MKRREFFSTGLATGTVLSTLNAGSLFAQGTESETEYVPKIPTETAETGRILNVGVIGAGVQGRALINLALTLPGIRFKAVCDIWPFVQKSIKLYLEEYEHDITVYEDYKDMLHSETGLDAVLIASPDCFHAEQTIAALDRGLHVYCEAMMSRTIEEAREMIRAMKRNERLLQIGYQRRSQPQYQHVRRRLLENSGKDRSTLTGQLVHFETQWNRRVSSELTWAQRTVINEETLRKFGFPEMQQFRNWRNYRQFGQGNCIRSLALQLDGMEYFFGIRPTAIVGMGGVDYYKTSECLDNVSVLLEYPFPNGTVRGISRVWTTTGGSSCRVFEQYYGIDGAIRLSDNPDWTQIFREPHAPSWEDRVQNGDLVKEHVAQRGEDPNAIKVRETGQVVSYRLPTPIEENPLLPHLRNFFNAIRGTESLNCSGEEAFPSHVLAMKIDEAIREQKRLSLEPEIWDV
ncbi:MAG: Gfo/Idh/MocA family protein [Thermoguttaceae bacterium]